MKPVLVLQHLSADGPAYLGRWLADREVPVDVRNTEAGDAYPETLAGYGALVILGGEMSANDALPSLRQAEALFREALREGVPTLGHCLGGQLMARALGARIGASPAPEVGFTTIERRPGPASEAWFGTGPLPPVFQWHYEAFDLPAGAEWLATSPACRHQAFSIGPHLAMQFHVELDAAKLEVWSRETGEKHRAAIGQYPDSVHPAARLRDDAVSLLPGHQALADRIYGRWLASARAR